ncbi:UDP-N-acetyl-D-glucosamine dehydrogenase [Sphaerisporangium melleum]|uniref:UDP-N-acetyl-D-glucosamine dehydrogenase n=1 Tax=Sphaerisporangium melleum TaxID=321316 RepID=A0A917QTR7_9ACTN|nr:nucleotide sugar dehydrogenase [Sphaerisporangium melleum]GGK67364.1 UDP-N-acetyl-D-glucosamine dehydrogenase [Sphaerisporangium melleum]GII68484.1 UDP-N-acetyl-D-glucosamine dehydrogenase [Sphaerisporangium melleum]
MGDKVVVVGQGYVGLPLAMRAVAAGFTVVGIDVDEWRVKRLNTGETYVQDVGSDVLDAAHRSGRYRAATDYAQAQGFDVCVITVPTPLRDGAPDLRHVADAGRSIAPYLSPGALVILESTTYPGTTQEYLLPLLEEGSGLRAPEDFLLGYSPERIDPGNERWRLDNTPKVVSGIDETSLARVDAFYRRLVDHTVPVSSPQVAELCKLLENMFRHVNVALVNELSIFARQLDIDVWEAIDAASTKPFGYMRFTPGPGVGGHCLPVDPSYLSWKVKNTLGHNFRFVELANDINDHMPEHVVHRLTLALNQRSKPVKGSRLLLLGLAYKKNTGDVRESPAVEVARALRKLGATVLAADPHVDPHLLPIDIEMTEPTPGEITRADAVVVLTDHDAFDFDLIQRAGAFVFDTRDRCRGANVERL